VFFDIRADVEMRHWKFQMDSVLAYRPHGSRAGRRSLDHLVKDLERMLQKAGVSAFYGFLRVGVPLPSPDVAAMREDGSGQAALRAVKAVTVKSRHRKSLMMNVFKLVSNRAKPLYASESR
jgi:hypothetical protein